MPKEALMANQKVIDAIKANHRVHATKQERALSELKSWLDRHAENIADVIIHAANEDRAHISSGELSAKCCILSSGIAFLTHLGTCKSLFATSTATQKILNEFFKAQYGKDCIRIYEDELNKPFDFVFIWREGT